MDSDADPYMREEADSSFSWSERRVAAVEDGFAAVGGGFDVFSTRMASILCLVSTALASRYAWLTGTYAVCTRVFAPWRVGDTHVGIL